MMMGSLEQDITLAATAPENLGEVVNDLDLTEEEVALENREEYLTKVYFISPYFGYLFNLFIGRYQRESHCMKLRC